MKKVNEYKAIFGERDGIAFDYKSYVIDYRIFVFPLNDGFQWEILENKSSYKNRWERIQWDDETEYGTSESSKRAAYKILKDL